MSELEKEFVPYELAVKLKQLGFDEPCLGRWLVITEWEKPTGEVRLQIGSKVENYSKNQCAAPLYQQAFRWFREKYQLQGYVYSTTVRGTKEGGKTFSDYCWHINGIDAPFLQTDARDMERVTYEEAELACLKTLIEIVKKK